MTAIFTRRHLVVMAITTFLSLGIISASDPPTRVDLRELARGNNQFALELYQQLKAEKGNLFLSPYSISTALAMTATGARGPTAEEMSKVLHLTGGAGKAATQFQQMQAYLLDQAKSYELRIANALWGQKAYPFKSDFVTGLQQRFRAEGRTLDFVKDPEGSRATINRWVEEATKEKIKELLPSGFITADTRMVLTNAIYFKGKWAEPFHKHLTKPADFFASEGESFKVDMMRRTDEFIYAENDAVQAVSLPYEGGRLEMVVVLPKKKDGLAAYEKALTSDQLETLMKGMRQRKVAVQLPRWRSTAQFKLKQTLMAMGMDSAFCTAGGVDFSGIDGTYGLFISEVVHKAYCEVNEEGTEAAGATGVGLAKASAPPVEDPPVEFKADHPYLYMIRDTQSGSLLFMGRMTDPRQ
jgi:serpin B